MSPAAYVTSRDISEVVGRSVYQVRYILESRQIEPLGRAGTVRLFHPRAVDQVREALAEIDRRGSGQDDQDDDQGRSEATKAS